MYEFNCCTDAELDAFLAANEGTRICWTVSRNSGRNVDYITDNDLWNSFDSLDDAVHAYANSVANMPREWDVERNCSGLGRHFAWAIEYRLECQAFEVDEDGDEYFVDYLLLDCDYYDGPEPEERVCVVIEAFADNGISQGHDEYDITAKEFEEDPFLENDPDFVTDRDWQGLGKLEVLGAEKFEIDESLWLESMRRDFPDAAYVRATAWRYLLPR